MLTHNNHFVPQLYLKHFALPDGKIHHHRLLVSRESVKPWKSSHVAGTGYQSDLYTRLVAGQETDDIERWLGRDFETPAEKPLQQVVEEGRLMKDDYRILSRFVAAQVVRTPAFLIKNLPRWLKEAELQMEAAPERIRKRLEEAKAKGIVYEPSDDPNAKFFPMRVRRVASEKSDSIKVRTDMVVGRAYWIYAIRHMLTSTLERLAQHRWTILESPRDLPWFTSDDPVVRLNYHDHTKYDFGGGWGSHGTEIILPISPKHLFYTQVGHKVPERGTVAPREQAMLLRRMIAEHAHRLIYNPHPDFAIQKLRTRHVDEAAVKQERDQWNRWHLEQSQAETELFQE